jgi:hypothetical protein
MGPGWNLVTYGGSSGAPSQALAQLGNAYTAVYLWDGTRWQRYFRPGIAPSFLNSITNVRRGSRCGSSRLLQFPDSRRPTDALR